MEIMIVRKLFGRSHMLTAVKGREPVPQRDGGVEP